MDWATARLAEQHLPPVPPLLPSPPERLLPRQLHYRHHHPPLTSAPPQPPHRPSIDSQQPQPAVAAPFRQPMAQGEAEAPLARAASWLPCSPAVQLADRNQ